MKLKTNLHLHTSEDPLDTNFIAYSAKEAIDEAARHGFEVLALTLHASCGYTPELAAYSESKGILLISGIEQYINGRHVLILNCDSRAEHVKTFAALEQYKKLKPDIFIIAPHPYFPGPIALGKQLNRYAALFDAVEHSWFYTKLFNRNRPAALFAQETGLPFIATSDTHKLEYLPTNYALIDASEKTVAAVFQAIREQRFENVTQPARFWKDMMYRIALKGIAFHPLRFLFGNLLSRESRRGSAVVPVPVKE